MIEIRWNYLFNYILNIKYIFQRMTVRTNPLIRTLHRYAYSKWIQRHVPPLPIFSLCQIKIFSSPVQLEVTDSLASFTCVIHLNNKRNRGSVRSRTSSSRCSFHLSRPKTSYTQFTFKHLHLRNHPRRMPLGPS